MYVQITTKCNMTCEHCGFACTNKGQNMTMQTFKNALKFCGDDYDGDCVQLGGGEPTLHPKFWEFMGLALGTGDVWLATNGSLTETALRLCKMARRGVIGCALSMDEWHDPIDCDVVEAFQDGMVRDHPSHSHYGYHANTMQRDCGNDRREIRDVSMNVSKRGRAIENELWHNDSCTCPGMMCRPNGDVYPCGCEDAPKIGNVNEPEALRDAIDKLNRDDAYVGTQCGHDIGKCEVDA